MEKSIKNELFPAELIREPVAKQIKSDHPDWTGEGFICHSDLNRYRTQYIKTLLHDEVGEITNLEQDISDKLLKHETL